ncbi:MAG: tetratricopeptide repeat protein [Archangiaceae bacterium]|nr:tetratricopeptide repeat protein [Archangiaceae bacterium]
MMLELVVALALCADDSLQALDRAVAARPSDPLPRLEAAQRRLQLGEELDRALFDADAARALLPENPRAHFVFGQLLEERGERAEARTAYQTALLLRDDYDDARFRLAGLLFQEQQWADAASAYGRYVKAHPEASGARLQLAAALEKQGDSKAAERELKAMLSDPKTHEVAGRRLAELYERTGRERDAKRLRSQVEPPKRKLRDLNRSAR